MDINSSQKIPPTYECKLCDYKTSNKKDFTRHINTIKHKNNINPQESTISSQNCPKHSCLNCGKEYKENSGLWKHKKRCSNEINEFYKLVKDEIIYSKEQNQKMIDYLLKENSEFKQILEQNKTMIEMIKNIQLTNKLN